MGNYISNNTVLLAAKRVLSKYNIESRVFKEMEKQSKKPVVAPKHEAGVIDYHKSLKGMHTLKINVWFKRQTLKLLLKCVSISENTEYLSKTTVVNKGLDDRLKDVYVTSEGLVIQLKHLSILFTI